MGGARCAVACCNNSYTTSKKRGHVLSLHSFPKDQDLKKIWIEACSRGDAWNPDTSLICSDHFALEDFIADQRLQLWTGVKWRPQLKPGAIPTRNLLQTKFRRFAGSREPHRRFSMFEVLSIELESQQKMNEDIPCDVEPNGHSPYADLNRPELNESITSQRSLNQDSTLADCDTAEVSNRLDISDNYSETENDRTNVFSLHPRKKSRIDINQSAYTSLKSPTFGSSGGDPQPANTSIIYSCPAYELFIDDD